MRTRTVSLITTGWFCEVERLKSISTAPWYYFVVISPMSTIRSTEKVKLAHLSIAMANVVCSLTDFIMDSILLPLTDSVLKIYCDKKYDVRGEWYGVGFGRQAKQYKASRFNTWLATAACEGAFLSLLFKQRVERPVLSVILIEVGNTSPTLGMIMRSIVTLFGGKVKEEKMSSASLLRDRSWAI